ncbi:MAG TPA: phage tail tip lysozyme [Mycobacterium sp.]|jgi:hypothetical protein
MNDAVAASIEDLGRRTEEGTKRTGRSIEGAFKPATETIRGLRNEFLALIGLSSLSVAGLERMFTSISSTTAELGRNAAAVGASAQSLYGWQGVARAFGGSAQDATSSIGSLTSAFARLRQFGEIDPVIGAYQSFLHRAIGANEDPQRLMQEALHRLDTSGMSMPERLAWGQKLNIAAPLIQATPQQRDYIRTKEQSWAPSDEEIKRFNDFNIAAELAHSVITSTWEKIAGQLAPAVTDLVNRFAQWVEKNQGWIAQKIPEVIEAIWNGMKTLAGWIQKAVDYMGGWENLITAVGAAFIAWKTVGVIQVIASLAASLLGIVGTLGSIPALAVAAAAALAYVFEGNKAQQGEIVAAAKAKGLTAHTDMIEGLQRELHGKKAFYFTNDATGAEVPWEEGLKTIGVDPKTGMGFAGPRDFLGTGLAGATSGRDAAIAAATGGGGGGGGGGGAETSTAQPSDSMRIAHDYYRSKGWTEDQTAGILGYLRGESGANLNINAFNPAGGGQGAQGIAQWRGARIDAFRRIYGHDPRGAPLQEQLEFVQHEFETSEAGAAARLRGSTSAYDAGGNVVQYFGRPLPQDVASERARRGGFAQGLAGRFGPGGAGAPASSTAAPRGLGPLPPSTLPADFFNLPGPVPVGHLGLVRNPDGSIGTPGGGFGRHASNVDNSRSSSNNVHIASITVNTQATDAHGIARDLGAKLRKMQFVNDANYGLA